MSPQEHITVCTSEEAGEIAELAFELGHISLKLSKDLHKALRFGFGDTDPSRGKTKIELLAEEINDLHGCIELLQEYGIKFPNLFNREAIDAKKAKVKHFMGIAENLGTIKNEIIPVKNKQEYLTKAEYDHVVQCLTEIYNPIRQKEFAQQLFSYVVEKIKTQFMPDGVGVSLSDRFFADVNIFKNQVVKSLVTGHKYYHIFNNKSFMDMIDVHILSETTTVTIQPNSPLEVLMHGVAPVKFFTGDDQEEVYELWKKHIQEFK